MKTIFPPKCPRCGSEKVAAIVYTIGADAKRLKQEIQSRRVVPAERVPTGNDPRWLCLRCRHEWGHPRGHSGAALDPRELA
jgi:hypothetical protein